MKAEIIASGTELLLGEITDTNTPFIARQLAILGIDLFYTSIVGDNYERFLGVLKQSLQRSDIVIITGGLGPTKGDITREVIAGLMGEKMEVDAGLKQQITEYFARLKLEMPENNLKQAMLIPSATAIPNPLGTAPGWWVEKNGKIIISLPGPPGEMQPMWQKEIYPRLEKKGQAVILSRTLKTWGLSEARIDQMVGPFMSSSNPTLALYAKADGIHLRITAKASSRDEALKLIRQREDELRRILQNNIWGADEETLEETISRLIQSKGLTLATAESFTGGLLACSIAGVPESYRFFKGGIIAFDANIKHSIGITPASEISEPETRTALRMAASARDKFDAGIGVAIDGPISATGSTLQDKACIAISLKNSGHDSVQTFQWRPGLLARRAVTAALFQLRQILLSLD